MNKIKGNTKLGKLLYSDENFNLQGFFKWMIKSGNMKTLSYNNGSVVYHSPEQSDSYEGEFDFTTETYSSVMRGPQQRVRLLYNTIHSFFDWVDGRIKLSYDTDDDLVFNIVNVPGEFPTTIWFETTKPLTDLYSEYIK